MKQPNNPMPQTWYTTCGRCTAKFFANAKPQRCPRCDSSVLTPIRMSTPWTVDRSAVQEPKSLVKQEPAKREPEKRNT